MNNPLVSIILVKHNDAPWLEVALESIKTQTYPQDQIEILIHDNMQDNIGFWAGFEKILPQAAGEFVIAMTDVRLDKDFIKNSVIRMEADETIGALQAKILQPDGKHIDTLGFRIERSRRVTNLGQGELDQGQYQQSKEIFAVEGAVPVFRRRALEESKVDGHIIDPDYRVGPLGYGDDLDLAWRMHLYGWKQVYDPSVIAWHDRSTTKGQAQAGIISAIFSSVERIGERRRISILKRRLDWSNTRFTIIKNDDIINILKDLPWILWRELMVWGYTLLFEPSVFLEAGRFFRLLPKMLHKRSMIRQDHRYSAAQMHIWFK